jgi:putative protease
MTGRDANHGECSQGCRWKYRLEEEKRPGEFFTVEEDKRGAYFFNSKDLCAFFDLHKFIEIGIDSFKIEGRMKSPHYAAVTAGVYKKAVTQYMANPSDYKPDNSLYEELLKVSHREFTDSFYFPDKGITQNFVSSGNTARSKYAGYLKTPGKQLREDRYSAVVDVKNTMRIGDVLRVLTPSWKKFSVQVTGIKSLDNVEHVYTKQYGEFILEISSKEKLEELTILRVDA